MRRKRRGLPEWAGRAVEWPASRLGAGGVLPYQPLHLSELLLHLLHQTQLCAGAYQIVIGVRGFKIGVPLQKIG